MERYDRTLAYRSSSAPRSSRRASPSAIALLLAVALAYVASYVVLRVHGTLYLYFSQGSYQIEDSEGAPRAVAVFLPLAWVEGAYRTRFTAPPPGG
jgi:hypothetical protein